MHNLTILPAIVAFSLIPLLTAYRFFTLRSRFSRMGDLRTQLPRENAVRYYLVLVSSCLLIGLTAIRSIGTIGTIAVCGVGVLGFLMSFQELYSSRKNGIYQHGFVFGAMQVFFKDVDLVIRESPYVLVIQYQDRSRKQLTIEDTNVQDLICKACGD